MNQATPVHNSDSKPGEAPRRIAFCITDLDPGGAEKALFQIVTHLDRQKWEPIVFCLGPEAELAPKFREQGIVTLCYGARSWQSWGVVSWLANELRHYRPELLQCFLFHANIVGRLAGWGASVPVILAGHRVAEREKRWHLWLERITRRWVNWHVCVSQGVADHLIRHAKLPPLQISVIPNGITPPVFSETPTNIRAERGWPDDTRLILAVGRLHPQKDFPTLIQAVAAVRKRHPDLRLLIAGEGPERGKLEELIQRLQLEEVIHLAGFRTDSPDLMRQSQVLAISSLWEGMSNVLLEAIAVGLPVVTTPVEGVAEFKDVNGLSIVVTSDLEKGLEDFFSQPPSGNPGKNILKIMPEEIISKEFTWNAISQKYSTLYESLITGKALFKKPEERLFECQTHQK
ncbi:MAG TPA: glycosyltransferase [Planctomicrobium sp.]|nr:glycosyltransferase [Planctomicrobium sp.]